MVHLPNSIPVSNMEEGFSINANIHFRKLLVLWIASTITEGILCDALVDKQLVPHPLTITMFQELDPIYYPFNQNHHKCQINELLIFYFLYLVGGGGGDLSFSHKGGPRLNVTKRINSLSYCYIMFLNNSDLETAGALTFISINYS